jgi:hypothetical protein
LTVSPFDFIKSINNKEYLMRDAFSEHEYAPFIVNMGFSLYADTLFQSNEINRRPHASNKMQYDYLYHSIKKGKRYSKWPKKDKINGENIRLIVDQYKYNVSKAKEALNVLTEEQIDIIKQEQEKGGKL